MQRFRWPIRVVGLALVVVGLFSVGRFVLELQAHQNADANQATAWKDLVQAAAGPAIPESSPAPDPSPGAVPSPLAGGLYVRLVVPKLNKEMVGIDSDWTGLAGRASLVHYHDSPAPGHHGNVLIAFHREFHWRDIDQLGPGDTVQLETTDRRTYSYTVDFVRIVSPSDISLLKPTDGSDLTMVTCDPWLVDSKRMIFRAHLVTGPGGPSTPAS
ncbi:MAG: sortase [Candidatus Dormibacteria bacterium]